MPSCAASPIWPQLNIRPGLRSANGGPAGARPAGPARDPAFPGVRAALRTAAALSGNTAMEDVTAWVHAAPHEVLAAAGHVLLVLGEYVDHYNFHRPSLRVLSCCTTWRLNVSRRGSATPQPRVVHVVVAAQGVLRRDRLGALAGGPTEDPGAALRRCHIRHQWKSPARVFRPGS
jgi:hypothetical protein